MSVHTESFGEIEIHCYPAGTTFRGNVPLFEAIGVGDRLAIVFTANETSTGPYSVRVSSPSGTTILDSLVRELPTGLPQSPPPLEFAPSAKGSYKVEIREVRGRQRGEAAVRIA
jgi:hypothetical protein